MKPKEGDVIREHTDEGFKDLGRVVATDYVEGWYYWIPFPGEDKHGVTRHFIKAPRRDSIAALNEDPENPRFSLLDYAGPASWTLTDAELEANCKAGSSKKTRRDLKKWLAKRRVIFGWIKPLFEDYKTRPLGLMDSDTVVRWAKERSTELGLKSHEQIVRAVRAYMLGGKLENSLLPAWGRSGGPGKPKISVNGRPGRKNTGADSGLPGHEGLILTAADRNNLHLGWKKYKKGGKSIDQAYKSTLAEFYSVSVQHVSSTEVVVTPKPANEMPTIAQFRRHGPNGDPELTATRIGIGPHRWDRDHRPIKGSSRDGVAAAGQIGYIDSTSDDQTLASSASRLKLLSSSHNVKLCEGYTGYILGLHSGFEHPSTMTNLMAIAHGATSKEAFCARYGITLKEGEWLHMALRRIRADNGELKSEGGVRQLTDAEISAEFVRSYAAELKGPVESAHHAISRDAGHQMAGSTRGRRHQRGDERKEDAYCLNHYEYMPHLIRSVLRFNNEDRVENLLTLEMRQDNVEPTRGAILKWMIENGYVATEPTNLNNLRATCLPRLSASIYNDGLYLFDPRPDRNGKLIPHLRYRSKWLDESGLTQRALKNVIHCTVGIDPSDLREVWLHMDGMQRLDLQSKDPQMSEITLLDWLTIGDDDKLKAFLSRIAMLPSDITYTASIDHSNKEAMKKRKEEEEKAEVKPTRAERNANKRESTGAERQLQNTNRLGLSTPGLASRVTAPVSSNDMYFAEEGDDWMEQVRSGATT